MYSTAAFKDAAFEDVTGVLPAIPPRTVEASQPDLRYLEKKRSTMAIEELERTFTDLRDRVHVIRRYL